MAFVIRALCRGHRVRVRIRAAYPGGASPQRVQFESVVFIFKLNLKLSLGLQHDLRSGFTGRNHIYTPSYDWKKKKKKTRLAGARIS